MQSENRDLVNECFTKLHEELGVFAKPAIRVICETVGGLPVHFPSLKTLAIEARNEAMREARSAGYDYPEILAFHVKRWPDLTIWTVRRIIDSPRRRQKAARRKKPSPAKGGAQR